MKKYIKISIVIIVVFLIIEILFFFFYKGRTVQYEVLNKNEKYKVYEKYVRDKSDSYYYLKIEFSDLIFNMQVPDIYGNDSYIVKDVYSFQDDNYTCILPIFIDDSVQTDILCRKSGKDIIYLYRNVKNDSLSLDNFALSMEKYGYLLNGKNEVSASKYGISILSSDLPVIAIPSYHGLYIIDNGVSFVNLFSSDVYKQPIQGVVDKYYVVADYDEHYSFDKFKIVDLVSKKVKQISSNNSISMNSYVQGIVDNCIYIMDSSNKKQYCLDIEKMTITLVGNLKKGILYYNGSEFVSRNVYDALNEELLFNTAMSQDGDDYVYFNNNIYYSYRKVNDNYDVYISYADMPSLYTRAFSISSIDRVQYAKDFVYYIEDDVLYSYSSKTGVNKVLTYQEFYYNSDLKFWIYEK